MKSKKGPGIRCTECGAVFDRSEYYTHICDCERQKAEKNAAQKAALTRQIVANNMRVIEQAQHEWDYA